MIDTPKDIYATLPTCIRFVMNGCKSPEDTTANCQPIFPGNHSDIWSGLGVDLRCATTECVCGGTKFDYALQHAFDAASYLCQTAFPSVENPSPGFTALGEMLSAFCSDGGFVLDGWVLAVVGATRQNGELVLFIKREISQITDRSRPGLGKQACSCFRSYKFRCPSCCTLFPVEEMGEGKKVGKGGDGKVAAAGSGGIP